MIDNKVIVEAIELTKTYGSNGEEVRALVADAVAKVHGAARGLPPAFGRADRSRIFR